MRLYMKWMRQKEFRDGSVSIKGRNQAHSVPQAHFLQYEAFYNLQYKRGAAGAIIFTQNLVYLGEKIFR